MTRFARMQKKKHLEATPWEELAGEHSGKKRIEEGNERTDQSHDKRDEKNTNKESKILKRKGTDINDSVELSCALKKPNTRDDSMETGHEVSSKNRKLKPDKQKRHTEKGREKNSQGKKNLGLESHKTIRHTDKPGLNRISSSAPSGNQRKQDKLEKRREARRKRREKKKVCLHCRQPGHKVSECPQSEVDRAIVGTCYKCGSSEHMTKKCGKTTGGDNPFPFAKCFVCGDMGHLARECPENPRGLYPRGGGCKVCGSVEHLKRDCPDKVQNKTKGSKDEQRYVSSSLSQKGHISADAELEQVQAKTSTTNTKRKGPRVVQF